MQSSWLVVGACGAALAVILGAFGAHGLEARLDMEALVLWETAARYLMYSSIGLLAIGLFERQVAGATGRSGWLLMAGGVVFCTTIMLLALGGPRWLGAVTPLGGGLMIAGWLAFAWGAFTASNQMARKQEETDE